MKILLAEPRGFCAGVNRALKGLEKVLSEHPAPVYVYHDIVHNNYVISKLKERGVVFVDALEEVPDNQVIVFSAHGASPEVELEAKAKNLKIIDLSCPIVKKIHDKVRQYLKQDKKIILIGDKDHPEIIGTFGQSNKQAIIVENVEDVKQLPSTKQDVVFLTQTTLSHENISPIIKALKEKYPQLEGDEDICYATTERQRAVKELAPNCDLFIVLGSEKSSNSKRLCETAERCGAKSILIDSPEDLKNIEIKPNVTIGISAAASAPEILVKQTIEFLNK